MTTLNLTGPHRPMPSRMTALAILGWPAEP